MKIGIYTKTSKLIQRTQYIHYLYRSMTTIFITFCVLHMYYINLMCITNWWICLFGY